MKKLLSLTLAVLLLCASVPAAAATMDLSNIRDNPKIFTIDVNTDDDVAFVESTMSAEDRSFVHKYESSNRYSTTKFDILVLNYSEPADSYPVMRLWVTYCADDAFLNISSVTFIIGEDEYTFTDVADEDWLVKDDNGYMENVLIKLGWENIGFTIRMEEPFENVSNYVEAAGNTTCRMILHGREDVEVELGKGFFLDFLLIKTGMISINGLEFLEKANCTPMTTRKVN